MSGLVSPRRATYRVVPAVGGVVRPDRWAVAAMGGRTARLPRPPATSAPVDHASRTGGGRTVRRPPAGAAVAALEVERRCAAARASRTWARRRHDWPPARRRRRLTISTPSASAAARIMSASGTAPAVSRDAPNGPAGSRPGHRAPQLAARRVRQGPQHPVHPLGVLLELEAGQAVWIVVGSRAAPS